MPPGRSAWDRRRSTDACIAWAICLVEPLVPLRRLVRLDERLAEATADDPGLVALVLAGVTSDVVRTLPSDDPWRSLVLPEREQAPDRLSAAQSAPDGPGAFPAVQRDPGARSGASGAPEGPIPLEPPRWPSGAPFGTWRDGTDLVELAWGSPERDPAFVPLADDLSPASARLLVAAVVGWRAAWAEARAILDNAGILAAAGEPGAAELSTQAGLAHTPLVDALRWACWRRRAYGIAPAEDVWPYEATHHWATRAFELLELGKDPNEAVVERDIAWHRIAEP